MTTLVSYCRLGLFEQQLQKGKQLSAAETAQLVESWEQVYRHPKRYISQQEARQVGEACSRGVRQTLQAFDVVHHPRYGQGIVVVETTTARGRELKMQFVDGTFLHFGNDDPALTQW